MKKNTIILSAVIFTLLAAGGAGIASASAAANSAAGKGVFHPFGFMNKKSLTDEEKSALDAKMKAVKEEQTAKQTAIDAALAAGDYNAWVKAVGENCPLLKKVTADNFSKYVQAHNLMKQARDIFKEIGIDQGFNFKGGPNGISPANGMGMGRGYGFERGTRQNQ